MVLMRSKYMDKLAQFFTETDFFFLNLALLFVVGIFCFVWRRREFTASQFLERLIWGSLISNVVLLAFRNFLVCRFDLSVYCPVSLGSVLIAALFFVPDLLFLGFCSGMYLLFSRKSEDRNTDLFPYDLNTLFVSGTLLVLPMGLVWRYGLLMD